MKKAFLLIVLPALLVALGFAQTPAPSGNTDPANIQGCLGGSDGNYTVAEDNTGQIFKITTSSVDLKPHLGHEVKLIGNKTTSAAGSAAADNSLAVTEVSMISEHCTPAVAAAAATVSAAPETVIPPAAPGAAPAAAPVNAPAETAVAPDAATPPAVTPPADTVVAPAPVIAPPAETAVTPAPVAAAHPTPSARPRKRLATPAAAAPVEPVSTPVAAAAPTPSPVSTTSDAASTPAPTAATPAVTHKSGSLWLIPAVVLLLILGIMVPLVNKWRKQKLLDQTSGENLSLTQEAVPVVDKSEGKSEDKTDVRKAA